MENWYHICVRNIEGHIAPQHTVKNLLNFNFKLWNSPTIIISLVVLSCFLYASMAEIDDVVSKWKLAYFFPKEHFIFIHHNFDRILAVVAHFFKLRWGLNAFLMSSCTFKLVFGHFAQIFKSKKNFSNSNEFNAIKSSLQ